MTHIGFLSNNSTMSLKMKSLIKSLIFLSMRISYLQFLNQFNIEPINGYYWKNIRHNGKNLRGAKKNTACSDGGGGCSATNSLDKSKVIIKKNSKSDLESKSAAGNNVETSTTGSEMNLSENSEMDDKKDGNVTTNSSGELTWTNNTKQCKGKHCKNKNCPNKECPNKDGHGPHDDEKDTNEKGNTNNDGTTNTNGNNKTDFPDNAKAESRNAKGVKEDDLLQWNQSRLKVDDVKGEQKKIEVELMRKDAVKLWTPQKFASINKQQIDRILVPAVIAEDKNSFTVKSENGGSGKDKEPSTTASITPTEYHHQNPYLAVIDFDKLKELSENQLYWLTSNMQLLPYLREQWMLNLPTNHGGHSDFRMLDVIEDIKEARKSSDHVSAWVNMWDQERPYAFVIKILSLFGYVHEVVNYRTDNKSPTGGNSGDSLGDLKARILQASFRDMWREVTEGFDIYTKNAGAAAWRQKGGWLGPFFYENDSWALFIFVASIIFVFNACCVRPVCDYEDTIINRHDPDYGIVGLILLKVSPLPWTAPCVNMSIAAILDLWPNTLAKHIADSCCTQLLGVKSKTAQYTVCIVPMLSVFQYFWLLCWCKGCRTICCDLVVRTAIGDCCMFLFGIPYMMSKIGLRNSNDENRSTAY